MAHARYPTPHEQLRILASRAQVRGLSFDEFWEEAVRPGRPAVTTWHLGQPAIIERWDVHLDFVIVWPHDTADRKLYQSATAAMREGWRRAYEGTTQTRGELALASLFAALEAPAASPAV